MTPPDHLRLEIDRLLATCHEPREALLQALLAIQNAAGCIDDQAVQHLGERLNLSAAEIEDVVTFYPALSRRPRGRLVIRVCHTLPCALVGGEAAAEYVAHKLGVALGETTADGRFTVEAVECLGLCDQGPAMMIGDQVHGRLTEGRIDRILGGIVNGGAVAVAVQAAGTAGGRHGRS